MNAWCSGVFCVVKVCVLDNGNLAVRIGIGSSIVPVLSVRSLIHVGQPMSRSIGDRWLPEHGDFPAR